MASTTVELRNVEGTQAAMGWAGGHTLIVDRPEGRAGGMGLGFNGLPSSSSRSPSAGAFATICAMSPKNWA